MPDVRTSRDAQQTRLLQVLGNFTLYDYKLPLDLPPELHHSFQVVVADPPYLVCLGCHT